MSSIIQQHKLLLLSEQADVYGRILETANLPGLKIVTGSLPPYPADCDLVFGEPSLIRQALPHLPNLKWVQSVWAGVEPLLDPTLRRDYTLTNAREVFGSLMAEFVFGYLVLHERKILQRLASQKKHRWDQTPPGTLRGKTLGLVGVGSIGAELARAAKFFGLTVHGYTRESEGCEHIDRYYHGAELLEFADGLDYLVAVLPNTSATRRLITAEVLARLPAHALFVNVGRGATVDESALIEALETERISGAILDVFEQEPLPAESPLWETKNLIVTSHTSAPSFPADISRVFIVNYLRYQAGQPLKHSVDFERGY